MSSVRITMPIWKMLPREATLGIDCLPADTNDPGKPADQYFVHHPDWVPTQNLGYKDHSISSDCKIQFLNKAVHDESSKKQTSPVKKHQSSSSGSEDPSEEFSIEEVNKYSMPQKRCCVASCLNRISKTKNSSPQIYYFKFPDDHLTRFRWIFLCQKKGTWDPDQCYICSVHFSPDSLIEDGSLKPSSVPTQGLFTETNKEGGRMIQLEGKAGVCSIPWCKTKQSEENRMEQFPRQEQLRNTWTELIFGARVPVYALDNCFICQDHFSKDQFVISEDSNVKVLREDAVPVKFTNPRISVTLSRDKDKTLLKRKSETVKEKESKSPNTQLEMKVKSLKTAVKDEQAVGNINNNIIKINKESVAGEMEKIVSERSIKVIQVGKIIKTRLLSDHTYSGLDSSGSEINIDDITDSKKRKNDLAKGRDESDNKKKNKGSSAVDSYNKDVEDLIADLLGEDGINQDPKNTKVSASQKLTANEDVSDSLGDYSDYSESDSDSDFGETRLKNLSSMSEKDLKELAEAQKYQLDDLKSENKELIDENERLRKELTIARTDPKYSNSNAEKSKFLSLVAKMFQKFLNEDQILSLIKSGNPSTAIAWTGETIDRAVTIHQACSDSGYDLLLDFGFPLPPRRLLSMIDRNKDNVDNSDSQ